MEASVCVLHLRHQLITKLNTITDWVFQPDVSLAVSSFDSRVHDFSADQKLHTRYGTCCGDAYCEHVRARTPHVIAHAAVTCTTNTSKHELHT